MPEDWSRAEVEATVTEYLEMLDADLQDIDFVKEYHIRRLADLLKRRNEGAVKYKYSNVSAVLRDLKMPWVEGITPYGNYQKLLYQVVEERVHANQTLLALMEQRAKETVEVPEVEDILKALEDPPRPNKPKSVPQWIQKQLARPKIDYLAREARNADLGGKGETFVFRYEQARLLHEGRSDLAKGIVHVSREEGDGAGFDIKSYEANGTDRFIEVKTTTYGKETPFYLTRNEVDCSNEYDSRYHLYRVFRFRKDPKLFTLAGQLQRVCRLDPITYLARVS
jgi:hypothetical protein